MRDFMVITSLLVLVRGPFVAGYSNWLPTKYYRLRSDYADGYKHVDYSLCNGYPYGLLNDKYSAPDTRGYRLGYLPPDCRQRGGFVSGGVGGGFIGRGGGGYSGSSFSGGSSDYTGSNKIINEDEINQLDEINRPTPISRSRSGSLTANTLTKTTPFGVTASGVGYAGSFVGTTSSLISEPKVTTNVYAYLPPKDLEIVPTSASIGPITPPKINYKIIFIKAPVPSAPNVPVIPAFTQDQEKTLIYVLVKKPEETPEIITPAVTPTVPSKPEVYFIRYRTQKQTQGVKTNGLRQPADVVYGPP